MIRRPGRVPIAALLLLVVLPLHHAQAPPGDDH
jgi:hypothetical protein